MVLPSADLFVCLFCFAVVRWRGLEQMCTTCTALRKRNLQSLFIRMTYQGFRHHLSRCSVHHNTGQTKGDAWGYGLNVCFPSLPPMLLCGFESRLGLESSDLSVWHFLKLVARGFLRVLQFPPLLRRLMVQPIK